MSASQIDMTFGLWTKSSKYELKHLLTIKSWILGLCCFFPDFSYLIPDMCTGETHQGVKTTHGGKYNNKQKQGGET